jgi:hypothetical protein
VEGEVHGGVELRDGLGQAGGLHSGERPCPCVDLGTLVAASATLCQTYITRDSTARSPQEIGFFFFFG